MLKFRTVALLAGASLLGACGAETAPQETEKQATREEFLASVYQDEEGKFIANQDEAFDSMAEVEAAYDSLANGEGKNQDGLAVYYLGYDVKWNSTTAMNLTYCVSSSSFGSRYSTVVNAMANAAAAWENTGARINFIHASSYDSNCTATQTGVVFDVRQTTTTSYLARAFFPNSARSSRNILISTSAFGNISPWTLTGVLRHELGHTIGMRHEHTRLSSTGCYEDANWRGLTVYDAKSVMHYPQCKGTQTGDLVLTSYDIAGVKALYP